VNTLSVERDGALVPVQLQRPEKLDAQTQETWFEDLLEAGTAWMEQRGPVHTGT
jgi:hypothetical protein